MHGHILAEVPATAGLGDLFGPVAKPAHEFAIVMRVARGQVELAVGRDGADRARRHAELAGQAWVVIDGLVVPRGFRTDQNRPQEDKIAELRVNHIAVDAHHAQPRGDGDGLYARRPTSFPASGRPPSGTPSAG